MSIKNSGERHNEQFKGIWIPARIWLDEDLTVHDKVLWATIDSLCSETRDCFASNEWLATRCKMTAGTVSNTIAKLKGKGLLIQTAFDGRERRISTVKVAGKTPSQDGSDSIPECTLPPVADVGRKGPLYGENKGENKEEKNTPISPRKTEDDQKAQEILSHLEAATGRKFTLNATRRSSILGRLSEVKGDIAGVKRMITRQVDLWSSNPEMAQYLTPETLFRPTKFVKYFDDRDQPVVRDAMAIRRAIEPHAAIVRNSPAFPGGPRWHDQTTMEQRQAYEAACVAIRKLDPSFNFDLLRR